MSDAEETEKAEPLMWLLDIGDIGLSMGGAARPGQVRVAAGDTTHYLSIEDARELFTHALVHMGGPSERADTVVAEVAIELCKHNADMRERAEKRLADLQEKHALQARHLGEYMGRLKKYEGT